MIAEALKKALLQAAIQGKLTEQLPEDGDARDLLKEIQKEKARLIKYGEIKKQKPIPEIKEDEIPFDIPENWIWCRLGTLVSIKTGSRDANWGSPTGKYRFFTCAKTTILSDTYSFEGKSIVMPGNGANVGDSWLVDEKFEAYQRTYVLQAISNKVFLEYIRIVLSSDWKTRYSGGVYGSAIPYIRLGELTDYKFPLPPLSEQTRIVEILNQFLPEIEGMKAHENKLYNLEKAFPSKIRTSILQAAIQGKLTEQLSEDGDARDLLNEIQKENARLNKEGKIKKQKPLPKITEDEIPFDIPENWTWIRMGDMVQIISGTSYSKDDLDEQDIRIIRGGNIDDEVNRLLLLDDDTYVSARLYDNEKEPISGDIIIVGSTGSKKVIGKPAFIDRTYENVQIGAFLRIIRPTSRLLFDYLKIIFSSEHYRKHIRSLAQGTNINNIKTSYLTEFIIPLPPLTEQKRMAEKLKDVLPLCTSLETTKH